MRSRVHIALFLVLLLTRIPGSGQDNLLYRQHMAHPLMLNPAIAGSEFFSLAAVSVRQQWAGIPQAPRSLLLSASVRMGNFGFYNPRKLINTSHLRSSERIGLGICAFHDASFPLMHQGITMAYSYHLNLDKARLALGLSANLQHYRLDESGLTTTFPDDPLVRGIREDFFQYNATAGLYYYSATVFGGLALHHFLPLRTPAVPGILQRPDLIAHGGYLFTEMNRARLELSGNVRYLDLDQVEADLQVRSYIQEDHWIALSLHSHQALGAHVGIKLSVIHLVYSYEMNLSNLIRYQAGTHAIHLGLNMGMRRTRGF